MAVVRAGPFQFALNVLWLYDKLLYFTDGDSPHSI